MKVDTWPILPVRALSLLAKTSTAAPGNVRKKWPRGASTVAQPVNTNFTTSFRYTGSAFPALPAAAGGSFPLTPPVITGGFTTFSSFEWETYAAMRESFWLGAANVVGSVGLGYLAVWLGAMFARAR